MTSNSNSTTIPLPAYLDLPPHLSAHKYFYVCTLTVLAWDTLVLTPRSYKLWRITKGWPALKWMYYFLQWFVLIDFIPTGVLFFSTTASQSTCKQFWPFEPICTAILIAVTSAVHVIRISAIYDQNSKVRATLWGLFAVQVVVTAICCGFYRSVKLDVGQGCIAGPIGSHSWVGIYWLAPTLLYAASFVFAARKSWASLESKPLSLWKLMLRDGLNLYGAILLVNLANMLFYFVMPPTPPLSTTTPVVTLEDPIKTIVTSMAAVLTTTMTMRIILSVRGSLVDGGSFMGSHFSGASSSTAASRSISNNHHGAHTLNLGGISGGGDIGSKGIPWEGDGKESVGEQEAVKGGMILPIVGEDPEIRVESPRPYGVQVTVESQVEYDDFPRGR
ncbi:hypothetical protein SERLA73DRAFT_182817 [Serpula lacrymans var. lacrymans S7.3]|uniref:Uncharacterized protein n=2 Tax=Serpula lacrymans var. lacrymans TaxID=341189 RepID=F8Q120_SERL3|nr:uncharacterized protein SERLADRAFT_469661 [Serpula lacrymans var. lacrymans S7.9]EGN97998.1 hypothetical protein SERLA73DRAFT_182817 [Serpula lacrymans var. lacrymans S7.3]EGO23590.1 hypothetical protein SERLADRAFT_469661 [Serpula lacrymans var. lacrymans S7.9]